MKRIILYGKDYSSVDLSNYKEDAQAIQEILYAHRLDHRKYLNHVSKLNYKHEDDALVSRDPYGNLSWKGIVGTTRIQAGDYDISIVLTSRFDKDKQHYFLCSMIENWLASRDIRIDKETVHAQPEDIFRFLWVYIFKLHLLDARETGIYKTYQHFEDNSSRIRGHIDVMRHIWLNMGLDNGRIATRYRENTVDNHVNHLIIHTYLHLKQIEPALVATVIDADGEAGPFLRQLMHQAPSYATAHLRTLLPKLRNPISHPLYVCYEQLRAVCLRILADTGASVFSEGDLEEMDTNGMLFYVPDLWEDYVEHQVLRPAGIRPDTQSENNARMLDVRPDFILHQNASRFVLDAKFKPLWETFDREKQYKSTDKFPTEDIRQCILYMQLLRAKATGTIFPVKEKANTHKHRKLGEFDHHVPYDCFHAIGMYIPAITEGLDYPQWTRLLRAEAQGTGEIIRHILQEIDA